MDFLKCVSSACGRAKLPVYGTMARRVTQCKVDGFVKAYVQHMQNS
jgi:hypothetical protein